MLIHKITDKLRVDKKSNPDKESKIELLLTTSHHNLKRITLLELPIMIIGENHK
jgi:hypothetical protein